MLLDPVYTLAAWEACECLAERADSPEANSTSALAQNTDQIIMLHTGGALGLQGLAQRFPSEF